MTLHGRCIWVFLSIFLMCIIALSCASKDVHILQNWIIMLLMIKPTADIHFHSKVSKQTLINKWVDNSLKRRIKLSIVVLSLLSSHKDEKTVITRTKIKMLALHLCPCNSDGLMLMVDDLCGLISELSFEILSVSG